MNEQGSETTRGASGRLRIVVSGASGMVGNALSQLLASQHDVDRLVRVSAATKALERDPLEWNPSEGLTRPESLLGVDAIVHLAGRSIASARWTADEKQRIRDSRVRATAKLVEQICGLERPPRIFIGASAVGIYGDCGTRVVSEDARVGDDFLATLANDWEQACDPLLEAGVRVCHARLGLVLNKREGALAKMLPLFQWALGGRLAGGAQMMSWIALDDCVSALRWLLESDSAAGPFNLVSPNPVTNREFTNVLAETLRRPAWLHVPRFALRLALGEMADALLLSSCAATPERLLASGFTFRWPELQPFLSAELQSPVHP